MPGHLLASFLMLSNMGALANEPVLVKDWQIRGFIAALDDPHQETVLYALRFRRAAAIFKAISNRPNTFQGEAQKQVASLSKLLTHEHAQVRAAAAQALGALGQHAKEHVPDLVKLLSAEEELRVRVAAAQALGALGQHAKEHVPDLVKLLKDPSSRARAAAARALGALGQHAKEHVLDLVKLLKDPSSSTRAAAARALGALGQHAKEHVPDLVKLLKDPSSSTRAAAARALGALGQHAKEHVPDLVKLLKDPSSRARAAAARALGALGQHAKEHVPDLVKLLSVEEELRVRVAAAQALGALGQHAKEHVPDLVKLLKDPSSSTRAAAARALGALGQHAKEHVPDLVKLLKDPSSSTRAAAARALGALGQHAKEHVPDLVKLLSAEEELRVRVAAAQALGALGQHAKEHVPDLVKLLDDESWPIRAAATLALGAVGSTARPHAHSLAKLLIDPNPAVRSAVAHALMDLGPFELSLTPSILINRYYNISLTGELRFLAHLLGGGDDNVEVFLAWLGLPGTTSPSNTRVDNRRDALQILTVFENAWPATGPHALLRRDVAYQVGKFITNNTWPEEAVHRRLTNFAGQLDEADFTSEATAIGEKVRELNSTNWLSPVLFFFFAHMIIWASLLFLYPKFPLVQAYFFWTPWVRRWCGLLYVEFLLTFVPILRRKLFAPFKDSLREDARIAEFDSKNYFGHAVVKTSDDREDRISSALSRLRGRIVLLGASGLGKTAFLRHFVSLQDTLIVFLIAADCSKGVRHAIQSKLMGVARDDNYLRKLIYAGALNVIIDGLNEAPPDTRAAITNFVKENPHCSVLLATQPFGSPLPANCKVYEMQPFTESQIAEYLTGRFATLPQNPTLTKDTFEARCERYLRSALSDSLPDEQRRAVRDVLSNPMDLTVVSHVLASGKNPDLFKLQEQYYFLMAEYYETNSPGNMAFPKATFSEYIYAMHLQDKLVFPAGEFLAELTAMEAKKMVVRYYKPQATKETPPLWVFRHAKIMDYFLVNALLGQDNLRPTKHRDDPRFHGALLQLANLLPLDKAEALERELINYAANTKNHSVSDDFVNALNSRRVTYEMPQATWANN